MTEPEAPGLLLHQLIAPLIGPMIEAKMMELVHITMGMHYEIATLFDQLDQRGVLPKAVSMAALAATRERLPAGTPARVGQGLRQIETLIDAAHRPLTPEEMRAQFRLLDGGPPPAAGMNPEGTASDEPKT
jgi:hypothetical protein